MVNVEQVQKIRAIAEKYSRFECVQCADAIQQYLVNQGIRGRRIKLFTGSSTGLDSYIYDDSVRGDAISENGRHEGILAIGIATTIDEELLVFDNIHPTGVLIDTWITNLQFYSKLLYGQSFQISEEDF